MTPPSARPIWVPSLGLGSFRLLVLAGGALLAGNPCWASIAFELPNVEFVGDRANPTRGSFDVVVSADPEDLPQSVGSFSVHFGIDGAAIHLGPPEAPETAPLLTGGSGVLDFSPDAQTIQAAHDVFPASAALADQLGLIGVPFEVPAGVSGTFTLDFLWPNELTDANALSLDLDTQDMGSITVLLPPLLQGDFDSDGDVDGDDFLAWQAGFGIQNGATPADGDADGDGDVDGDDFLTWQAQFGSIAGTASAAVPEPTSIAILFVWAAAGMFSHVARIG